MNSQDKLSQADASVATRNRPQPMGKTAGKGVFWMVGNTVWSKFLAFFAQWALGILLSDGDFGVYAIAIAIADIGLIFRNGGVTQILIQRGSEQWDRLSGAAFWIAALFSVMGGLLLFVAGPVVAKAYGAAGIRDVLWIVALSLPLSCPAAFFLTKLRIDLRFREVSRISAVSATIHQSGIVLFALLGAGPLSFVLPMLLTALYGNVAGYRLTCTKPWHRGLGLELWGGLLRQSWWIVAGALATGLAAKGDYLVLGAMLEEERVGVYFFAYMISIQVSVLLAQSLQSVLFPVLSSLSNEPVRQEQAAVRVLRALCFAVAPLSYGFAAVAQWLESAMWNGKWSGAVVPMMILSATVPMRFGSAVAQNLLMSRAKFASRCILVLLQGIVLVVTAWVAARIYGEDLERLVLMIALFQTICNIAAGWYFMDRPCSLLYMTWVQLWPTALGAVSGAGGWYAAEALDAENPWLRVLAGSVTTGILFLVLSRLLASGYYRDIAKILPAPMERMLVRLLRL